MPIRRKNWDIARGEGLVFNVEYKLKDTDGSLETIPLYGWSASLSMRDKGREFLNLSESPDISVSESEGRISVNISPENIRLIPGSCDYIIMLSKEDSLNQISAIARGVIRVSP